MSSLPELSPLDDEAGRLAALDRLDAQTHAGEAGFRRITEIACLTLGIEMASVSLIEADTQWLKARQNLAFKSCPRELSVCTHTIRTYDPMIVEDMTRDPRFRDLPTVISEPNIRCYAGVPLTTPEGYNIGALCVMGPGPRRFTSHEVMVLDKLAQLIMEQLHLRSLANVDFLTGLRSRRSFMDAFDRQLKTIRQTGGAATLCLIDIDFFKTVNDRHGHPVGDRVLAELGETLREGSREGDVVGRLGGEEFAALLPATSPDQGLAWAERIRADVAARRFCGDLGLHLTLSAGLAPVTAMTPDVADILHAADAALYDAKRHGRNTSVMA